MRILLMTLLLSLTVACKKEKLITSLPEVTNSGRNTLGFLVENKVWVPHWTKYSWSEPPCRELEAEYLPFNKSFELSGGIKIDDKRSYFSLYMDSVSTTGVFTSNCTVSLMDSDGMLVSNGGDYDNVCSPTGSAIVTINTLDTVNKIVAGTFQATLKKASVVGRNMEDLYPNSPAYIEIKDGRFDVHYNYCR